MTAAMWVPDHKTYMEDGLVREARAADREKETMSERIDHAVKALEGVSDLPDNDQRDYTYNRIMVAQVHATLALVEQQRIANLIAVAQMEGGPHKDANNWIVAVFDANGRYVDDQDANAVIHDRIREGLELSS